MTSVGLSDDRSTHPFSLSPLRASVGKEAFSVTLAADRPYLARLINRSRVHFCLKIAIESYLI